MKKQIQWIYIFIFFFFINIIFNFSLWKELFGNKMTISDNIVTEFLVERSYQSILHIENPFVTKSILYPFKINYSLNDPNTAYVLPFIFLRPFFNSHKSLIIIVLMGFLLNMILMYLLLKKLKIDEGISLLVSLIFSFTPLLSYRAQVHYTYVSIYFFPLTYLIINQFLFAKSNNKKLLLSVTFGLFIAFVLLSNFYYFLMILLAIFFYFVYLLFQDIKKLLIFFKVSIFYIFSSVVSFFLILLPWFFSVYQIIRTKNSSTVSEFGGAITLSSDIISFFTPSEYNPFYKILFNKTALIIPLFSKYNSFFLNSWERFAYPGIIIVSVYLLIIFLKIFKKFPSSLWNNIKSYFILSIVFIVLMLGPFLKIFNRWTIDLEGITVVFPLPFLIIHYIPGLSTLRAPSRFVSIFVFFACIVAAYVLNFFLNKANKKKYVILLIVLFLIFFVDQFYVFPKNLNQEIPYKIYQYLSNKPKATVFEIPFTVRDGFQYLGFVHAIQPMEGQLIHGKPIIGGYLARVPDLIFNYYKNLKFIGYIAKIIDKGNYDPFKENPKEPKIYIFPYDLKIAKQELDILNVNYIILKENESYANILKNYFMKLNFKKTFSDNGYVLFEKL